MTDTSRALTSQLATRRSRDTEGPSQVALRCSFERSPSSGSCLANRSDWTPRRLPPYLNPRLSARRGRSWDALHVDPMSHAARRLPAGFDTVCSEAAQHVQADACNPDSWFSKMGTRTSWDCRHRLRTGFRRRAGAFTPPCSLRRALVPPKRAGTEPVTRRRGARRAPVPVASSFPPRAFAAAVW